MTELITELITSMFVEQPLVNSVGLLERAIEFGGTGLRAEQT